MAGPVTCPRCGAANNPGTLFCVTCGSALSAGAGGAAAAAPMYPGAMPGMPSAWDAGRKTQIDRTKIGILLLLIGTLLGWIPTIGVIGLLLIFIGAILVILGRKAFGAAHARNVILSILLVIVGIGIIVAAAIVLVAATLTGFVPGSAPRQADVASSLSTFLILVCVGGPVIYLATVFFTYAIQNKMGRMLLLGGYAATVIIQIVVFALVSPAIGGFVADMFPNGTYVGSAAATIAIRAFSDRVQSIAYLNAISAFIFAGAYYLVWTRINKGEIPAPATPPTMAAAPMPPW